MAGPRYAPRDYTLHPDAFGRAPQLVWLEPESAAEAARVRAALLQHRYVFRIRERLKVRRVTLKKYAADAGMSYQRLSRLLRGEVIMRLEDLAMADLILGEVTEMGRAEVERARAREKERVDHEEAVRADAVRRYARQAR